MNGIVLREANEIIQCEARQRNVETMVCDPLKVAYGRSLIVDPEIAVAWALVTDGFSLLNHWEVAAPLSPSRALAKDLGTPDERERTQELAFDLRIPVYAPELLFVCQTEEGQRFLECWLEECQDGADKQLAFTRALCLVKPLFCGLPRSWLTNSLKDQQPVRVRREPREPIPSLSQRVQLTPFPIIRVEVAPGRFVRCRPGEEEQMKARFANARRR